MQLIDCHSHISFPAYDTDRQEVLLRATEEQTGIITVGTNLSTSQAAVDCAESHQNVWATVGLHPGHVHQGHEDPNEGEGSGQAEKFDHDAYLKIIQSSKKVVAIGECGLDYYRVPENINFDDYKNSQQQVFRQYLDLAFETNLPVMVHCRDAHDDLCKILEEYATNQKPIRGNVHCFTGTSTEAARYLQLGWYISFTGIATFPPRKADIAAGLETTADVIKSIPLDHLLIETDAPYLAPVPHRGKKNEPAFVKHVAEFIAQVRGVSYEEIANSTTENTKKLFSI